MTNFMPAPHCLDRYSFGVNVRIVMCEPSNFILLFPDCFSNSLEFLRFQIFKCLCKFSGQLVNVCKEASWDFNKDCVESVDEFEATLFFPLNSICWSADLNSR